MIGTTISHYTILEKPGKGVMSVVYNAPKLSASVLQQAEAVLTPKVFGSSRYVGSSDGRYL